MALKWRKNPKKPREEVTDWEVERKSEWETVKDLHEWVIKQWMKTL